MEFELEDRVKYFENPKTEDGSEIELSPGTVKGTRENLFWVEWDDESDPDWYNADQLRLVSRKGGEEETASR